ncbi:Activator of basal transcription 1 [Coemansia sp. RSA 1813]|nr:Activator of basal transcription 1 [Coemansia sp. RSA 1646]KAJ1770566.1 Activator of basal transcription 1 [Coemansia sp. RSA 1843]KAJ2211188.1 Activator of basal transcription 1 [Coemansia sp. RSA 487]KAJ2569095.1 Activator of basal transcription 1 [Coemansia sp. RSA 1813]
MSTRPKAKDWTYPLSSNEADSQASSDEQSSYEEETSRSKAIQACHTHEEDSSSDSEDGEGSETGNNSSSDKVNKDSDIEDYFVGDNYEEDSASEDDGSASNAKEAAATLTKKKNAKPLSEKEILKSRNKEAKSGVVYMSRIPPFMKAVKVRHMLKKYAEIGRIYFIQEDDQKRKRRVKNGGNRRKLFVEGWIEFANKKYAKAVAQMLNNTPMGGKKHGFYHDDLWNLKYLPKFKWRHLVDQLASEQAAKQQRLQSEISQSRRELDSYLKNVDRAKKMASIKTKRDAKIKKGENVRQFEDKTRSVWQRDVVVHDTGNTAAEETSSANKRRRTQQSTSIASVLDHIF